MSQLPREAASLQACVGCCPVWTAEGPYPRTGGSVQSTGGGHGVCPQGSRDGYRRGMMTEQEPLGVYEIKNFTGKLQCFYRLHPTQCQHQFRNRRWNCSTTPRGINVFGRVMNQGTTHSSHDVTEKRDETLKIRGPASCFSGTREAAFVHALSSAAVAVAVTRACTRGELERCGCDRKVRGVSPEGELGFCSTISHQVIVLHFSEPSADWWWKNHKHTHFVLEKVFRM